MKSFLLAAALLGASLPATALAYTPKDAASTPAPRVVTSSVVKPGIPPGLSRTLVEVEFSLDASGKPQNIRVPSVRDPIFKHYLVEAFRQWRFEAGSAEATAAGKRFILPIEIRAES